jgi:PAS domain S-box-containing protein
MPTDDLGPNDATAAAEPLAAGGAPHDGSPSELERRSPVRARRELDRRIMTVIEGMSDAFLALDEEWRVIYANREAARLNRTTPEALVGCNHWERWPETVGSPVERLYRHAMATREPLQFEHHYADDDIWHEVRVHPGEDGGLAVFYRDITVQKRLEAERERQARELRLANEKAHTAEAQFRLIVDRVQDYAIMVLDPDGVITHWGRGAERINGWRTDEIVGRHLRLLYPDDGPPEDGSAEEHLRHAAEHGEYTGEGRRQRRGGEQFPARVVLTALRRRDGRLMGFSKITQDLTVEREREAVVARAMAAAESASLAKSQFLANTSHEIRTPLNAIMGYADLLEMGLAGPLGERQRIFLGRIQDASRHLLSLVNDVIDLSKIEAGAMRASADAVPVADAVLGALRLVDPQARARRLSIVNGCSDTRIMMLADEERVRQVLTNLLSNAVRFTEPGGHVTITCGRAERAPASVASSHERRWAFVRVEDTGVGIPPDQMERIWEAFTQADASHTRRVGGSGLGLTISRHLARVMGGDITAHSRQGVGSSFVLWLPAATERAEVPARRSGRRAAIRGQRLDDALAMAEQPVPELEEVADGLLADAEQLLARHLERLREDPEVPHAVGLSDLELEDHLITFISDLAQSLAGAGHEGAEGIAMLHDSTAIQRVIGQRHGLQRARHGWTEGEVRREYALLGEALHAAIAAQAESGGAAAERAHGVMRHLLERANSNFFLHIIISFGR